METPAHSVNCTRCGYDLSGQTLTHAPGVRCPECGEPDAAAERPAPGPRFLASRVLLSGFLSMGAAMALALNASFAVIVCIAGAGYVGWGAVRRATPVERVLMTPFLLWPVPFAVHWMLRGR
ncbi:MAG: hypothetical protein ACOYN0_00105 [Phycisphaerales bacterium]